MHEFRGPTQAAVSAENAGGARRRRRGSAIMSRRPHRERIARDSDHRPHRRPRRHARHRRPGDRAGSSGRADVPAPEHRRRAAGQRRGRLRVVRQRRVGGQWRHRDVALRRRLHLLRHGAWRHRHAGDAHLHAVPDRSGADSPPRATRHRQGGLGAHPGQRTRDERVDDQERARSGRARGHRAAHRDGRAGAAPRPLHALPAAPRRARRRAGRAARLRSGQRRPLLGRLRRRVQSRRPTSGPSIPRASCST